MNYSHVMNNDSCLVPGAARRGFALVDAVALIGLVGVLAGVGVTASTQPNALVAARQSARQLKDANQMNQQIKAMITWSINNKDLYPLPSQIDKKDTTVKEVGKAKDHSANIYSIMIWNGSITAELAISPLENNKNITAHTRFETFDPAAAVKPKLAQWDPAFSADFTAPPKKGHLSYAHLQPSGGRRSRWANTFNSDEAVISTRGPEITGVKVHDETSATPTFANADSNTFRFFDPAGAWSGNVAFNDSHVDFIKDHFKPGAKVETSAFYTVKDKDTSKEKKMPDMAFFDEPDDATSVNNFLGIFTKAGDKPADFKTIWD